MTWFKKEKKSINVSILKMLDITASWFNRSYDNFAREGYIQNVVANRCINMISWGVAKINFQVYVNDTEQPNHPLKLLLENPNPFYSGTDFIKTIISYLLIGGNAYIINLPKEAKTPSELQLLRPNLVNVKVQNGSIYYTYNSNFKTQTFVVDITNEKNPPVLHLKTFNPLDNTIGLSQAESAAFSIDQHNQAGVWNKALLQNGAKPSGALIVKDKELSPEQFKNLKTQIDEDFSGSKNSGRPLLLEGGLEWKEMGLSPKDMDFLNSKHSSARDIAIAFGVPSQLIGIPGDTTYSNMVEARQDFFENTVIPWTEYLTDSFNKWLSPRYGSNVKIKYDLTSVGELAERRQIQIKSVIDQYDKGLITVNEARELLGRRRLPGGDELYISAGKLPINFAMDNLIDDDRPNE